MSALRPQSHLASSSLSAMRFSGTHLYRSPLRYTEDNSKRTHDALATIFQQHSKTRENTTTDQMDSLKLSVNALGGDVTVKSHVVKERGMLGIRTEVKGNEKLVRHVDRMIKLPLRALVMMQNTMRKVRNVFTNEDLPKVSYRFSETTVENRQPVTQPNTDYSGEKLESLLERKGFRAFTQGGYRQASGFSSFQM